MGGRYFDKLAERMLNQAITDQASIDKYINRIAIEFLYLGFGNEARARELSLAVPASSFDYRVILNIARPAMEAAAATRFAPSVRPRPMESTGRASLSENLINTLAVIAHRRRDQHGVAGRMQFEMFAGMRQRVMRHERSDMRKLG